VYSKALRDRVDDHVGIDHRPTDSSLRLSCSSGVDAVDSPALAVLKKAQLIGWAVAA
jgi:hypothetical protein